MRKVAVMQTHEDEILYGLWMDSDDRAQRLDIPAVAADYYAKVERRPGTVSPLYVVNTEYDEARGTFRLFVGSTREVAGLSTCVLPKGEWGVVPVDTRFAKLTGLFIGRIKRFFYTKWLPASGYMSRDYTCECHVKDGIDSGYTVSMLFGIARKEGLAP